MKLNGHKRQSVVDNPFVGAVVAVYKPFPESFGNFPYRETMILRREITFVLASLYHGLILAPVTEFHFISRPAKRERENLIAETNT